MQCLKGFKSPKPLGRTRPFKIDFICNNVFSVTGTEVLSGPGYVGPDDECQQAVRKRGSDALHDPDGGGLFGVTAVQTEANSDRLRRR